MIPALAGAGASEHVGALDDECTIDACCREIGAAMRERGIVVVAGVDLRGRGWPRAPLRGLLDALPCRSVVPAELLETKAALLSRCDVERHQRSLQHNGAAAAHRIEQRGPGPPTGEAQQAGGEVLAQGRLGTLTAQASLEQRLAGGVEIERRIGRGEVRVHAHVGAFLADARTDTGRVRDGGRTRRP